MGQLPYPVVTRSGQLPAEEDSMRNQEVEAIFGQGDLGPIENYLDAIATEERLPRFAIGMCLLRMEEAAPALRAVLVRAAEGEKQSDDEWRLFFRGVYILGGARDTKSCQPLLRLLRRPELELDDLLGDAITEDLPRIMAGVFDGNVDAFFSLITDGSVDQFVRKALFDAAAFLSWNGSIARERIRGLLERFDEESLADDGDEAWVGWLTAIALLGLRDMAPRVYRALDESRCPDWVIGRSDFDEILAEAEQKPDDDARFEELHIGYIEDVVETLEWTDRDIRDDELNKSLDEDDLDESDLDKVWTPSEPVRNPWRNVGRNDPCPCGSGKKFKKCCLGKVDPL
jgi:hypothetical protein